MELFTALQYLKIDIANSFGLDKLNYDKRLEWFDKTIPDVSEYTSKQIKEFCEKNQAEDVHLALAGLLAYKDYLLGIPSGYRVAFDSCNSGTQIMSALTRDINGLKLTGMLDNNRYDFYTEVFKVFKQRTNSTEQIERKHLKKAIMTSMYGSKDRPYKILGKHNYEVFVQIMEEMVSGAWTLRNVLIDEWKPDVDVQEWLLPDGYNAYCPVEVQETKEFNYEGITIDYKVTVNKPKESDLSMAANVVHSVDAYIARELIRRCKYDKYAIQYVLHLHNQLGKQAFEPIAEEDMQKLGKLGELIYLYETTGMLSVRIIEYIKDISDLMQLSSKHREHLIDTLRLMIQYKPFDIAVIHDSFSVLPNNMNFVRYWYNSIIANIVDSDLLQFLLDQCCVSHIQLDRQLSSRTKLAEKVRESNYGIC